MKTPFCLLLTGEPNSGKSTLAYALLQKQLRNCLIIDGDKHREMQFLGKQLGFSRLDIILNNEHVIKLARFAMDQGFNVIIPQIMPYKEQRKDFKDILDYDVYDISLRCPKSERSKRLNFRDSELVYELGVPDLEIDTSVYSIDECVDMILGMLG